jgi:hypothetical protein
VTGQQSIVADNLSKSRFEFGWVSAVRSHRRPIWIRGRRSRRPKTIVRADEKLTAFLELETAIRTCGE